MPSLPPTNLQAANSKVIIYMDTHRLLLICKLCRTLKMSCCLLPSSILFRKGSAANNAIYPLLLICKVSPNTEKSSVVYYCSVQGKFTTARAMASLPKRKFTLHMEMPWAAFEQSVMCDGVTDCLYVGLPENNYSKDSAHHMILRGLQTACVWFCLTCTGI